MADILSLTELFDNVNSNNSDGDIVFNCVPIHGLLPLEDQCRVFDDPIPGELKVIIATNSAESSLTLPDVDFVIDLGQHKMIQYNEKTHRQLLTPAWICKAAAKQRAGRTGRVRPGFVYRLYSRSHYDLFMPEYDPGDVVREPLDTVILTLKTMLKKGGGVSSVLEDLIEPPDYSNIEASLKALHKFALLLEPEDDSELTSLGSFVSSCGLGIELGRFLGLSAQIGLLNEAIYVAAALNLPKEPWRIASPLIHKDPDVYNDIMTGVFAAKWKFSRDESEPIALMNLMRAFEDADSKGSFISEHYLAKSRMLAIMQMLKNLRSRLAETLRCRPDALKLTQFPVPPGKLKLLKVALTWVFIDNILVAPRASPTALRNVKAIVEKSDATCGAAIVVDVEVEPSKSDVGKLLKPVLSANGVSHESLRVHQVHLSSMPKYDLDKEKIDKVLLHYAAQAAKNNVPVVTFFVDITYSEDGYNDYDDMMDYYDDYDDSDDYDSSELSVNIIQFAVIFISDIEVETEGTASFSRLLEEEYGFKKTKGIGKKRENLRIFENGYAMKKKEKNTLKKDISAHFPTSCNGLISEDTLSVNLILPGSDDSKKMEVAWETYTKNIFQNIAQKFGTKQVTYKQQLRFPGRTLREASYGPRMLQQLCAGRRKVDAIFIPLERQDHQDNKKGEQVKIKIKVPTMKLNFLDAEDKSSFLSQNSVLASMLDDSTETTYMIATARLDLAGGRSVAEGLTMLPEGEDFLEKCLLTFGEDSLLGGGKKLSRGTIEKCADFHETCKDLKEALLCKRKVVEKLCEIFDVEAIDLTDYACLESVEDKI